MVAKGLIPLKRNRAPLRIPSGPLRSITCCALRARFSLIQGVVPAKAGIHGSEARAADRWVPAFAGTTVWGVFVSSWRIRGSATGLCHRLIVYLGYFTSMDQ